MSTFNTIHIFGFGVVQIIGKDFNMQTPVNEIQAEVDAVVDNVWSTKPTENTGTKEYHAINIFNTMFSDWQPKIKGEKGFRTNYDQLDDTLIHALIMAVINNQPAPANDSNGVVNP